MGKNTQARAMSSAPTGQVRLQRDGERWNLRLYGIVGDEWDGMTDDMIADVINEVPSGDPMDVHINSPGGAVFVGLTAYNHIAARSGETRIVVDGIAASIASVIAMAGSPVVMASGAMMMIHNPWNIVMGDAQEMRKNADVLDKVSESLLGIYERKTGQDRDTLKVMMDEETWLTAEEAIEWGFADEMLSESTDAAAAMASIDLSILPNIPNNVAQAVARHRIAGQSRGARAAQPAVTSTSDGGNDMSNVTDPKKAADNQAADDHGAAQAAEPKQETQVNEQEIRDEAIKAERDRVAQIRRAVRAASLGEDFADELVRDGVSVEEAQAKVIDKWAAKEDPATDTQSHVRVEGLRDETEKVREGMRNAILGRARVIQPDPANEYRGMRLMDMARESLERAGANPRGMSPMEIVGAAFTHSTSDFGTVLEEALHKTLLDSYQAVPDTWRRFCAVGNLSDFRPHNRYRMGTFGNLETVDENGEFRHGTLSDAEKETIQAETKGKLLTISRQMIVNDDLGAFIGVAQKMGRGAARTVEIDVYALLTSNSGNGPTMNDGNPLFDAAHNNIVSIGATPSVATFEDMRVLMAQQQDPDGNDYLDLRPSVWLGPVGQGGDARVVNDAQYDPDTSNKLQKPNKVRGLVDDIVDTPRLSGTVHYMFTSPMDNPVLEVGFLDGEDMPFLDQQDGFTVDGTSFKVRLDYGVAAVDWRGVVKNPGQ